MKPLILILASLFSYSALAEVEALNFDVSRFGEACVAELQTRDGSLIESFQERSCEEALAQCEYYLDQLHQQGRNPFATCGIVENEYAPYPPPYSDRYRPPGHHRPPPPYPPPYNPPRPPPYNPPRPPPPYNPPRPPPYNPPRPPPPYNPPYPPPYRDESWVCRANDRGHEEHYGGHEGYGRSQSEAADNAMHLCLLEHGRCSISGCQRSYR
ncbi:MAG: hypothetical protein JNM39_10315 [Bdellovibrionaceae bacterium]|nr:hypothetical protein [Pseudobdellovibrionaceae bacterium]